MFFKKQESSQYTCLKDIREVCSIYLEQSDSGANNLFSGFHPTKFVIN